MINPPPQSSELMLRKTEVRKHRNTEYSTVSIESYSYMPHYYVMPADTYLNKVNLFFEETNIFLRIVFQYTIQCLPL